MAVGAAGSYESTRLAHVAYAQQLLPEYIARLYWSRAQIESEQKRGLRALLRHATERSPWYRERLRRIDLDHPLAAQFAEIPPMTKRDLMESWDAIVTEPGCTLAEAERHLEGLSVDAYFRGDLHVVASGGSSGVRGVFVYGWQAWALAFAGVTRGLQAALARVQPPHPGPTAAVTAELATHATSAIGQTFSSPQRPTVRAPVTWRLDRIVAALNQVGPSMLMCYASMLAVLAEEARSGRLRIQPALICSTAEPLLPEVRLAAEQIWGPRVVNVFATTESIGVAFPCAQGPGFHLAEDLNVVELVDAQGAPVPRGTRSARILLTNLYNASLPLIRYEISDELEIAPDPCACGSAYLKVNDVHGRADDVFMYPGGVRVHPHAFRSALGRRAAIVEYQVRQSARGAEVDLRTRAELDVAALRAELEQHLRELGVAEPEVRLRRVETLDRQGAGKLRRFVPRAL